MIHDTERSDLTGVKWALYIYAICSHKTMCPPGYHYNVFMATHALGHMMYGGAISVHHVPRCMSCLKAIVVITGGTLFS